MSAVIAIVVLLAAIAGVFCVNPITGSEAATNSAITNAADSVSTAANKAGDAASGGKLATLAAIRRAVGEERSSATRVSYHHHHRDVG